jgi:23S rRNA pseudouridine2457 synthase
VLIAFNKPFGVICKFSPEPGKRTLADFIDVPRVYPAGRLDTDSEGLLLLTDDGALQTRIADPATSSPRSTGRRSKARRRRTHSTPLRKGVDLGRLQNEARRRAAHR